MMITILCLLLSAGMLFGTVLFRERVDAETAPANEVVFIAIDKIDSVQIAASNGTTAFGVILPGTVLGKITASGKYRPVAKQFAAATGSLNTVTMESVKGFFVGDIVTIYDASDPGSSVTGRTITAINTATPSLTFSGGAFTFAAGDYIYVEDGSATARGYARSGINTIEGVLPTGVIDSADQGVSLVYEGVVDEDKADAIIKHNSLIKTDLQTVANGVWIIFK